MSKEVRFHPGRYLNSLVDLFQNPARIEDERLQSRVRATKSLLENSEESDVPERAIDADAPLQEIATSEDVWATIDSIAIPVRNARARLIHDVLRGQLALPETVCKRMLDWMDHSEWPWDRLQKQIDNRANSRLRRQARLMSETAHQALAAAAPELQHPNPARVLRDTMIKDLFRDMPSIVESLIDQAYSGTSYWHRLNDSPILDGGLSGSASDDIDSIRLLAERQAAAYEVRPGDYQHWVQRRMQGMIDPLLELNYYIAIYVLFFDIEYGSDDNKKNLDKLARDMSLKMREALALATDAYEIQRPWHTDEEAILRHSALVSAIALPSANEMEMSVSGDGIDLEDEAALEAILVAEDSPEVASVALNPAAPSNVIPMPRVPVIPDPLRSSIMPLPLELSLIGSAQHYADDVLARARVGAEHALPALRAPQDHHSLKSLIAPATHGTLVPFRLPVSMSQAFAERFSSHSLRSPAQTRARNPVGTFPLRAMRGR